MADKRFFTHAGPVTLGELAKLTGAVVTPASDKKFADVAPLDRAGADDISFLDNIKYLDSFTKSKAGACFVHPKHTARAPEGMILLVTEKPYTAYAMAAQRFYPERTFTPAISPQAAIADSVTLGENLRIEPGAVIGEGVKIGNNSWIGANTVIGDAVEIGENARIGANCTISHTLIGKGFVCHGGVHIGQDGFGFAPGPKGIVKVPQLGRVLIGDGVEIGAGTCIDRGAGPDTVIGDFSKIDNLVQIGHNVRLGKYVIIAAQSGISGSTVIEDGVMLGGQVGISGHVTIGAGAKIAAQAGIMRDVPAGETYGGFPAVPMRDWHRQTLAVAKLMTKKE